MNVWEWQFYRQLSHAAPDDTAAALERWPTGGGQHERHVALQAALRQALVDSERVYGD
jgi:hypothetical protein